MHIERRRFSERKCVTRFFYLRETVLRENFFVRERERDENLPRKLHNSAIFCLTRLNLNFRRLIGILTNWSWESKCPFLTSFDFLTLVVTYHRPQ